MLDVQIKKQVGIFKIDINFKSENWILGLLGASGCGKSMTLKCIAGLETPDEGHIVLDGQVLFDSKQGINVPPLKRQIGYLFQNYALFLHMTVLQNIACGQKKLTEQEKKEVQKLIHLFQLEGLEHHYPHQLSGGQKQRVALARMLRAQPKVILLDEPFSALDQHLKSHLKESLKVMCTAFEGPVIMVSHDQEEVRFMCDQIVVLNKGRSGQMRNKEDFYRRPRTEEEARLVGNINVSAIEVLGPKNIHALDWGCSLETPWPISKQVTHIGIFTHHIEVGLDQEETQNTLKVSFQSYEEGVFSERLITKGPRLVIDCLKGTVGSHNTQENLYIKLPKEYLIDLRKEF